jgi:APA family basic amino acid/polyamine antiporter
LFYVLSVGAVFVLRRTQPDVPRPYRAAGFPIVPGAYIGLAALIMIDLLIVKPRYSWPGLLIVASGIPVFYWWRRRAPTGPAA